jgi:hypothetical protein
MKTTEKIKRLLSDCDANEINMVIRMIKDRRDVLEMEARATFHVGDLISFAHKKVGEMNGVVKKLNIKTAVIKAENGEKWKVPLSILSQCPASHSIPVKWAGL